MRPFLERLPWTEGSSFALLYRQLDDGIPFQWHHHPEWELTLTLDSQGQRFIGDHVGQYESGDLVLVGPNLAHTWMSTGAKRGPAEGQPPHRAYVIWFTQAWADQMAALPECAPIARLLARARQGLALSAATGAAVRPLIEDFFQSAPQDQLFLLIRILNALEGDGGAVPLSSAPMQHPTASGARARVDRVLTHIHTHFARPLPMVELAKVAAISPSGLHRLFLRQVGQTVTGYIMGLRIGAAAARLAAGTDPISHIAADVGYSALANFNRQFKAAKGMTPRDYRTSFQSGAGRRG